MRAVPPTRGALAHSVGKASADVGAIGAPTRQGGTPSRGCPPFVAVACHGRQPVHPLVPVGGGGSAERMQEPSLRSFGPASRGRESVPLPPRTEGRGLRRKMKVAPGHTRRVDAAKAVVEAPLAMHATAMNWHLDFMTAFHNFTLAHNFGNARGRESAYRPGLLHAGGAIEAPASRSERIRGGPSGQGLARSKVQMIRAEGYSAPSIVVLGILNVCACRTSESSCTSEGRDRRGATQELSP